MQGTRAPDAEAIADELRGSYQEYQRKKRAVLVKEVDRVLHAKHWQFYYSQAGSQTEERLQVLSHIHARHSCDCQCADDPGPLP